MIVKLQAWYLEAHFIIISQSSSAMQADSILAELRGAAEGCTTLCENAASVRRANKEKVRIKIHPITFVDRIFFLMTDL